MLFFCHSKVGSYLRERLDDEDPFFKPYPAQLIDQKAAGPSTTGTTEPVKKILACSPITKQRLDLDNAHILRTKDVSSSTNDIQTNRKVCVHNLAVLHWKQQRDLYNLPSKSNTVEKSDDVSENQQRTSTSSFTNDVMHLIRRLTRSDTTAVKAELDQSKLFRRVGRRGRGRGQFEMPCGVTSTKSGDLVVADTENHRIQLFSPDGVFKSKFGEKGSQPDQLCYPIGVAMTTNDNIVVSDSVNAAVKVFNPNGHLEKCFVHSRDLEFPYGVAVTTDDDIVVTDICKHCVAVLTPTGSVSHTFGRYGDAPNEFDHPYCVTTNSSKQIIISDTGNNSVKIFHFQGRLLRCFSSLEFRLPPETFVSLYGICTDTDDNTLVVCNTGVYILTKNGRLWEVLTSKDGLTSPKCIAFSPSGRLMVTQAGYDVKHELCIFRYNKEDYKSLNTLVYYAISI